MLRGFNIKSLLKDKIPQKTKAVVAMSGGVDSSVAAALLHSLGYKVIGVTLQLYNINSNLRKGACCAGQDIYDAKCVAENIGFPHYVLNYEEIFKKEVIDTFISSYMEGETPIPCIKCNQTVKFRDLLRVTQNLGADVLVTGHYAKRLEEKNGKVKLCRGVDQSKDQSYFLFIITEKQLNLLRFPLGELYKNDVRRLAKYFGLQVSEKPDSQDLCFVSTKSYSKTIAQLAPHSVRKGKIIDIHGNVLGEHTGIVNFTVGQRKGLGISYNKALYVVRINTENNEVVVGPINALMQKRILIKEMNWLEQPEEGMEVTVKLRASHAGSLARIQSIDVESKACVITLEEDYFGISPGQACVAYKGEQVIGGGWICSSL